MIPYSIQFSSLPQAWQIGEANYTATTNTEIHWYSTITQTTNKQTEI